VRGRAHIETGHSNPRAHSANNGSPSLYVMKGRVLAGAVQIMGNNPFPVHHHL
jgi:hypothetical protein